MDGIRIVLVEPAGPLNVGSVARVMKNFGLSQLVLVNPQCDRQDPQARQMAVHGGDLLAGAVEVGSLPEALAGCGRVLATSGRDRLVPLPLGTPRQMLPWLLGSRSAGDLGEVPGALVFGREDRGLTNGELHYAQGLVQIPSTDTYGSLNLAQAVAVCAYELRCLWLEWRSPSGLMPLLGGAWGDDRPLDKFSPNPEPRGMEPGAGLDATGLDATGLDATGLGAREYGAREYGARELGIGDRDLAEFSHLERYYHQLEQLLLSIGYLYPHTAPSRMAKLRRLYGRAQLSTQELALLQGMVRQMVWALGAAESGADCLDK